MFVDYESIYPTLGAPKNSGCEGHTEIIVHKWCACIIKHS